MAEELRETLEEAIRGPLITKAIEALIIIGIVYIILLVSKILLRRLQRREIISALVEEQVYRLLSLFMYTVAIVTVLYMFTSAHEVFYVLLVVLAAVLFSGWQVIGNIITYYVLLLSRHMHRVAALIEFPRLGIRGKIVEINPFYVKLRTPAGKIAYLPNMLVLSEVMLQLTSVQSTIALRVEAESEPSLESANSIENRIREAVEEARVVLRPQDIAIKLVEVDGRKLVFHVEVPVAGAEPRPAVITAIVASIAEKLADHRPRISLVEHI